MASKSLSFLLFGEDVTASRAFEKVAASAEKSSGTIKGAFSKGSLLGVGVLVAGLGLAAKGAADFQTQMVRLVTAAGESQSNLALVSKGVMAISTSTGTSLKATGDAMYYVESAGFHGAAGLKVLTAATQGAKIEGADTKVVANALTTALTDLGSKAGPPAVVMSKLVSIVAHGKMTMDDLAGSLHSVLPNAVKFGLSLDEVGAAISTMTAQGISAEQATQNLNFTILKLGNPTAVMTKAMAALGINSTQVAHDLGKQGLAGTITELSNAITSHMGPAGLTISAALNTSQIAAGKVTEGYKAMTPAAQKYFDQLVSGAKVSNTMKSGTLGLSLAQDTQIKQLVVLYKRANGFNDLLKSGAPDALTYAAAMAKISGGQVSLQTMLHLTGENLVTLKQNTADNAKATADAAGNVKDFTEKQKTLNQKLDQLKVSASNAGVAFGADLIPALSSAAGFLLKHKTAVEGVVLSLVGLKIAIGAVKLAQETWAASSAIVTATKGIVSGASAAVSAIGMGPLGLAAGVVGLSVVFAASHKWFGLFGDSAKAQVAPVSALTDAILADGDALGELTRKQVINDLQSKGLYDAALKMGVGQGVLTDAAMGNVKAIGMVNDSIAQYTKGLDLGRKQIQVWDPVAKKMFNRWVDITGAQKDAYDGANKVAAGLGLEKKQLDASYIAATNKAIADGKATAASQLHAAAIANASTKLQLETQAAQSVTTKLRGVHDVINTIPALKNTELRVASTIALARLQSVHDAVDTIPRNVDITIGVNNNVGQAVHDAVNSIGGKPHAGGGYLSPGWNSYDPRGETLVFNGGGRNTKVLSASATRAAGSGGNIFNVTVNAGIGTNGAQVGKEVVGVIEKYIGAGGTATISKGIR